MKIKDKFLVPPGGWDYTQPETATHFAVPSWGGLLADVKKHRLGNQLPIPLNFNKQMENDWCARHPDKCTFEEDDRPPNLVAAAWEFGKAMIFWAKEGFPKVDNETFERRQKICLGCPFYKGWGDGAIAICRRCRCANGRLTIKLIMATEKCPESKW